MEDEVRNMQSELVAVRQERMHLEQHRRMMTCPNVCPPPTMSCPNAFGPCPGPPPCPGAPPCPGGHPCAPPCQRPVFNEFIAETTPVYFRLYYFSLPVRHVVLLRVI